MSEALIRKHFDELADAFSGLMLCEDEPGRWVIRGTLSFAATFENVTINDEFSVLISIPSGYPNAPPTVQETGGRIPPNFHQYGDRTLCLGAPVEIHKRFKSNPRLKPFVETVVIEFLYGYSHLEKYGKLPFGELSHGPQGIREYYEDVFRTHDLQTVLALLKVLADDTYRGHLTCPCDSGLILRKCHGPTLLGLLEHMPPKQFLLDAQNVVHSLGEGELKQIDWSLLPKQLKRAFEQLSRREKARTGN